MHVEICNCRLGLSKAIPDCMDTVWSLKQAWELNLIQKLTMAQATCSIFFHDPQKKNHTQQQPLVSRSLWNRRWRSLHPVSHRTKSHGSHGFSCTGSRMLQCAQRRPSKPQTQPQQNHTMKASGSPHTIAATTISRQMTRKSQSTLFFEIIWNSIRVPHELRQIKRLRYSSRQAHSHGCSVTDWTVAWHLRRKCQVRYHTGPPLTPWWHGANC